MEQTHRLLTRQLRKHFGNIESVPKQFDSFIAAVNDAYCSFDSDRELLERSIEISSMELMQSVSLISATLESTDDGILVVDLNGKVASYNGKFLKIWNIPEHIAATKDDNKLLDCVVANLIDAEDFLAKVRYLYSHPEEQSLDTMRFRDGRILERFSAPHKIGGSIVGRVWSFRDVTVRIKAEDAIRESKQMLQLVMDNIPQSVFWKNRNLVYLGCNVNFAKAAGLEKPGDIVGKTDYDLAWRKEEADFFRQCDSEIMSSDTPRYHIVEPQRQADGKEAWVDANKVPLHDVDGNVVGILGTFEDITERREAQDKLRMSEERYRMIFDNANDAIFLMDSNKFIDCNEKTLEIFACTREQIIGKEPYRFSPSVQPDGRNSMEKAFEKIGAALAGKPQKFEWVHCKYSGDEFYSEVTLNAFIIRGKPHVLAIVRDVSERKAAERQIEKSRQTLYQIIDSMPFGVMVVGKDKIIRIINTAAAQLTGFDEGELVGHLCHKTLCTADENSCPVLDKKQILDRSERKAITKDKRGIPILKSVIPIKLGDEEVLLESFVDISERKRAEEDIKEINGELERAVRKLEETNQEMKNFVYIASHDLREPLRKISAFGTMLKKSLTNKISSDDAENLSFMIDGAARMSKMIEGLLAYSRVSTKAHSAEMVNLNDIVKQIGELELSVLIEEKHTTLDVPQPLPAVNVDPVQIRQLMQNLIANGMKYQAKGNKPHITITSKPAADGMVRINVTDNGIGIAPEFQQAIFIMFKRLHSKNEYEGTGIGLAVCKKIVERHGGQIGVESEPGKGSAFWFTVPAAKIDSKEGEFETEASFKENQ